METVMLGESIESKLLHAVRTSNVESIKELSLVLGGPHCKKKELNEALCEAVRINNVEAVKVILLCRADVAYVDADGKRPLHYAAELGYVDIVKVIVAAGSPVNVLDATGLAPLHYAVLNSDKDMIICLLQKGATVNRVKTYQNNETPLHFATKTGKIEICQHLINKGGDVNAQTLDKLTPLHLAVKGRNLVIVEMCCSVRNALVDQGDATGQTALHMATEISSTNILQALLGMGHASPSAGDKRKRTPLHYVASYDPPNESCSTIARLLIEHGACVTVPDSDGLTPLHHTALSGNSELASILIDNGADINAKDKIIGDTPLTMAISHNRNNVINILIERGADVNIGDNSLMGPLLRIQGTRNSNKLAVVEMLLQNGAQVNQLSDRGYSPLDRCVFHSVMGGFSASTLARLVQAGAMLHKKPQPPATRLLHRNSALCWLTWHGELQCATFLVNAGWDMTGESWIYLRGSKPVVNTFLEWLREVANSPRTLKVLCRSAIRKHLNIVFHDTDICPPLSLLPLPNIIKSMLKLEPETRDLDP